MRAYTLYFEWFEGQPVGDLAPHDLEADDLATAKVKAAIIYAGASFHPTPPQAYRIEGPGGMTVYRFPEAQRAYG